MSTFEPSRAYKTPSMKRGVVLVSSTARHMANPGSERTDTLIESCVVNITLSAGLSHGPGSNAEFI